VSTTTRFLCSSEFIQYESTAVFLINGLDRDLETGTIHYAFGGLTYDATPIYAPMGTYPSFAFTPSDDAIVIWAAGQIYYIPLSTNARGERVSSPSYSPRVIPFTAHVEMKLAETRKINKDIVGLETADHQRVYAFKELSVDKTGKHAVVQAAGKSYVVDVENRKTKEVPVLHGDSPYYSPSFIPGESLLIHQRWSDVNFTSFEIADLSAGEAYVVEGLEFGRYYAPAVSACSTYGKRSIAFVRTGGDYLTGNIVATAGAGLYVGTIDLSDLSHLSVQDIRSVPLTANVGGQPRLRFVGECGKGAGTLLVQTSDSAFTVDLDGKPDSLGKYTTQMLATGRMSSELSLGDGHAAFVDFQHVYVAPVPAKKGKGGDPVELWSKPGNATKGVARVSLDGGHDLAWSDDGKKLFWFLGKLRSFDSRLRGAYRRLLDH
jgi:hypothetical protein